MLFFLVWISADKNFINKLKMDYFQFYSSFLLPIFYNFTSYKHINLMVAGLAVGENLVNIIVYRSFCLTKDQAKSQNVYYLPYGSHTWKITFQIIWKFANLL